MMDRDGTKLILNVYMIVMNIATEIAFKSVRKYEIKKAITS